MKNHHVKELQDLRETMQLNQDFNRNTDKAFLVLLLYIISNGNKNTYIELLSSCCIPRENSINIFNCTRNLIQNNNTFKFAIEHNKNIKIERDPKEPASKQCKNECHFIKQYRKKLKLLISGFVESRTAKRVESNLFGLCVDYMDEVTLSLKMPDKNIMIKSPISALIYLYTNKCTDCFNGTLIQRGNDHKQCEWINAVCTDSISLVDHHIFIRLLFDSFQRDFKFMTNSMNIDHKQSTHHLCISLCEHLIISSIKLQQSQPKKWNFFFYFIRFLNENKLKIYTKESKEKHPKGLGLQLSKQICSRYNLKSGPYCKIKKEINLWCYDTFSPTIYGWWSWYNRTIKKWITFPKELKKWFITFNNSYSKNQIYVDIMWCRFRIIRSTKDYKEINVANNGDIDVIPISPNIPNIPNTMNRSNNNKPIISELKLFKKYRQRIISGFIRNLSFHRNGYSNSVAIYIADYLNNKNPKNALNVKRKDPPKNPLSLLCYLYGIHYQINSLILRMNLSAQRTALRSHDLLNQIQLQIDIDMETKVFLTALLDEYYSDISVLNIRKHQNEWCSQHICLSLFSQIINNSAPNDQTERAQYHFFILFCRYIEENNITIQKLAICGKEMVRMICDFYAVKPNKYYLTMTRIIVNWRADNMRAAIHRKL